jgi:hypothetical protein
MALKLTAHASDYHTEHTLNLTSKRIKLAEHDNQHLHQHYDDAVDKILEYWNTHYHLGKYSDIHAHLDSNLHWSPIKKKGQKRPSKEVRRLTHSKDVHHLEGKYYTHRQLLNMMALKANKTLKNSKDTLQDWTESMYRRFNAYIEWCKEWDSKYNQSKYYAELDQLKVRITWLKD